MGQITNKTQNRTTNVQKNRVGAKRRSMHQRRELIQASLPLSSRFYLLSYLLQVFCCSFLSFSHIIALYLTYVHSYQYCLLNSILQVPWCSFSSFFLTIRHSYLSTSISFQSLGHWKQKWSSGLQKPLGFAHFTRRLVLPSDKEDCTGELWVGTSNKWKHCGSQRMKICCKGVLRFQRT